MRRPAEAGLLLKYDGTSWAPLRTGTTQPLNRVLRGAGRDLWLLGDGGCGAARPALRCWQQARPVGAGPRPLHRNNFAAAGSRRADPAGAKHRLCRGCYSHRRRRNLPRFASVTARPAKIKEMQKKWFRSRSFLGPLRPA